MARKSHKVQLLERRRNRVRKKIAGTATHPRLSVRRTLKHIYAQLIDDTAGRTLAASSSLQLQISGGNVDGAKAVGKDLAERAKDQPIEGVRFDRNGRLFHGRVKALAEGAREGGLKF